MPQPPMSPQFPGPVYPLVPYGFGFMANASNSGPIPHFMQKPFGGSNYKGNNNYKTNGGFKSKGYNIGNSSDFSYGNSRSNGSNVWNGNTESRSTTVIECQICNKRGHTAVNCFHRNATTPNTRFQMECQICGKKRSLSS
ncbi:hypothetical protein ACFX14_042747 [Malus domestica]